MTLLIHRQSAMTVYYDTITVSQRRVTVKLFKVQEVSIFFAISLLVCAGQQITSNYTLIEKIKNKEKNSRHIYI